MEEKINFRFLFIGLLSILLTAVSITMVFHNAFQEQAKEDLQNSAAIIAKSTLFLSDPEQLAEYSNDKLRITLIASDGQVQYESSADEAQMENHLSRPEIQAALQSGSGESLRQSTTLGYDTYYYALRLQDGKVLRVAIEIRNMYSIFEKALPSVILIGFLILLVSVLLSSLLTKRLIKPIEVMAQHMDTMEENTPYKELIPFVRTIKEQQKKKMETAQMRQEFTANVSHELKTPLTSISGYAEMIETGIAKPEDIPVFAEKIHSESQRLLELIGDIMKLSELDEGRKDLFFEQIDLLQVAQETQNRLQLQAQRAEVSVTVEGVPAPVNGNLKLLNELAFNLCDNAIRYNHPGGSVAMRTVCEEGRAMLIVSDNGIGIAPDYQSRVFERFYRVDKSRSKETGGTGLGLAIVKHIAIQHHALLSLNSKPGEGTKITVSFPLFQKAADCQQQ
ncbi:MAG: ATP-binding protein [Oscillospiraceae bacterium]|nr:ATP-binding protein [Oscillospiraceae bacterium]